MFCPKCGAQNIDDAKYCRGCGSDLSNVLASLEGKPKTKRPKANLSEKAVALYGRAVRGVFTGVGFIVIAAILRSIRPETSVLWVLPLTFAFVWFAASIGRLVQASGLRKLAARQPNELPAAREEFIPPARSFYDTDDLAATPFSVTERTTNLLKMEDDLDG